MEPNKKFNLNEIEKTSPFKVPENYFDDFAEKMQHQTAFAPPQSKVPFMVILKPYLYMAASFVLLLSLTLTVVYTNKDSGTLLSNNAADSATHKTIAANIKQKAADTTNQSEISASEQSADEAYVDDLEADEYDLSYLDEFDDEI